jgi:hypothetical protein
MTKNDKWSATRFKEQRDEIINQHRQQQHPASDISHRRHALLLSRVDANRHEGDSAHPARNPGKNAIIVHELAADP